MAKEVIKRGLCVSDTVVVTKIKDSVVYKDSIVETIKNVPCKDFDSTIGRARIKVSSGVLSYTYKDSIVYRTQTVTNTVRDRSLERILGENIAKLDSEVSKKDLVIRGLELKHKETTQELGWMTLKFWSLFALALIIIFRKQIIWLFLRS